MKIQSLTAHQILDSRGLPTIEVHLTLEDGKVAVASAPSGLSVGSHEAVELRDHDYGSYLGFSVGKAISNLEKIIAPELVGKEVTDQRKLDESLIKLDGTDDKSHLGGNTLVAASTAIAKGGALSEGIPDYAYTAKLAENSQPLYMPTPMFNIINGGLHGTGNLDFQEFMVVPARRMIYNTALKIGDEIYLHLKDVLTKHGLLTSVGDEGGFTPTLFTNASALDLIVEAVKESGYAMGKDVFISLDIAANQLRHGDRYFVKDSSEPFSTEALITFYKTLIDRYSILSLEDPMAENDLEGWNKLNTALEGRTLVVGDDLTTTNSRKLAQYVADGALTAIIIKPNQIGTITETIEVVKVARDHQITSIISHRSGETTDTFIADFAVGVGADYIKAGAPARGERVAKYNRLLEIEEQLAAKAS